MKKIILIFITVAVGSLSFSSLAQESAKKVKKRGLFDQATDYLKGNTESDETPEAKNSEKTETNDTAVEPAAPPEKKSRDLTPVDRKTKTKLALGVGTVEMVGDSGSVLAETYESSLSSQFVFGFEFPIFNRAFIETGLGLSAIGSELKYSSSTELTLLYLMVPLNYKHEILKFGEFSGLYLKGGVTPMLLLDATIKTCDSAACDYADDIDDDDLEDDLDAWLTTRESAKSHFQQFSILGNAGVGADFLLFTDFIVSSMWLQTEVVYHRSLSSINKGEGLGKDIVLEGFFFNLGLALTF